MSCDTSVCMTYERRELGARAEAEAADWYRQRGYKVLARNWRCADGELDLVVLAPDGTVVFSEVKARSSGRFGVPAEAVTLDKQRRLRMLAVQFLRANPARGTPGRPGRRGNALRFDVVSVRDGRIEVLQAAF